jgi:hypothetical protein
MEIPAGLIRFFCRAFSGGGGPRQRVVRLLPMSFRTRYSLVPRESLADQTNRLSVVEYDFEDVFRRGEDDVREHFVVAAALLVLGEKEPPLVFDHLAKMGPIAS